MFPIYCVHKAFRPLRLNFNPLDFQCNQKNIFRVLFLSDLGSLSWDDLENDLPDELIPNGGDLSLMGGMSSNGGAAPGAGPPSGVPDAAAKHKQLSELLRGNTSGITGAGLNSASPQPGGLGSQLGSQLGKSPLGQGSPSNHPSPQAQKAGTPGGVAGPNGNAAAMGFGPAMMNSGQGHGGQVMNGGLGPEAGRGRGAGVPAGLQYQGASMQGAAAGPGAAGSALAETLSQGAQQMGAHGNLTAAQQAGNMNKVSEAATQSVTGAGRHVGAEFTFLWCRCFAYFSTHDGLF